MLCINCNQQLKGKYQKKFCSKSCATTHNNKFRQPCRKAKLRKCRTCNAMIDWKHGQRVHCFECIKNKKHYRGTPIEIQTIEEVVKRAGPNRYDGIRVHARNLYKKMLNNPLCEKCGYTKHVEICHKQPVSTFPKSTLVCEVNKRDNILFLCPNCHWEYDCSDH